MPKVDWLKYKEWSGIRVRGTKRMGPPTSSTLHMDRASYLAMSLESPTMGTVQSYDRAAMSGGPFHFIAVYPKNMAQGPLFKLLRSLEVAAPCADLEALWAAFAKEGWFIARDGKLRNIKSGLQVSGKTIRNVFTPLEGKVPKVGHRRWQAEKWALLFHRLLANPVTFGAQQDFATEYLLRGQHALESSFYNGYDPLTLRAGEAYTENQIMAPMDLALSVYHAHSVNAPGPARNCLKAAQKEFGDARFSLEGAAYLIWRLGRYRYGRWQDTADGRNRYDHTRVKAMKSDLWPSELFTGSTAIMPKNLSVKRPANTRLLLV